MSNSIYGLFISTEGEDFLFDSIISAIDHRRRSGEELKLLLYSASEEGVNVTGPLVTTGNGGIHDIAETYTKVYATLVNNGASAIIQAGKPKMETLLFAAAGKEPAPGISYFMDRLIMGGSHTTLSLVERELLLEPEYLCRLFGLPKNNRWWFPHVARLV